MTMEFRKDDWWWDFTWTPVSGCRPVSEGCRLCWSLPWLKRHTWQTPTVYTGAIEKAAVDGSLRWTGNLTRLEDGDRMWKRPHNNRVANPALGPNRPNLVFAVVDGDLFVTGRPKADINLVCATLAASPHYGLLCSKYTGEMADYFTTLDPRTVKRWQPQLLLGFSAETQKRFDERLTDVRRLIDAGWFVYVALSPLLEAVTLPPEWLALGARTWVVVYGECNRWESRPSTPMKPDWARALYAQCKAAGIPFFLRGMHTGARIPPDLVGLRQFPKLEQF
jgi:protein gp37